MVGDEYMEGKSKQDLLRSLYTYAQPNSKVWEQQRMAIFVRCSEDLECSVKAFTRSNNKLSGRVLWLNVILDAFTVVGTELPIWSIIKT